MQEFLTSLFKTCYVTWASRLSTRKLLKGQSVGYGGTFTAVEDMIISTYDIGYGDGFLT